MRGEPIKSGDLAAASGQVAGEVPGGCVEARHNNGDLCPACLKAVMNGNSRLKPHACKVHHRPYIACMLRSTAALHPWGSYPVSRECLLMHFSSLALPASECETVSLGALS